MTNKPVHLLGLALTSEQGRNGVDEIEVLLVQEQVQVICFLPVRCHVGWDDHIVHECENIDKNGVLGLEFRKLFYRHGPHATLQVQSI